MSGFRHNRTVSGSPSHSNPCDYSDWVTNRLHRYYGTHDLHFITGGCYRNQPGLGSAWRRDLFLKILEEARRKYRFVVHGYVVMPEHFHLLINEPEVGDPSVVMKGDQGAFLPTGEPQAKASCGRAGCPLGAGAGTGLAEAFL
jgi:hypothetical protein